MKLKLNPIGNIHIIGGILLAMLLGQTTRAETQFTNEFWISTVVQTNGGVNGVYGNGTLDCPFDGSTQDRFDHVMHYLSYDAYMRFNATIHLLAGTYQTLGSYTTIGDSWPIIGWRLQNGQHLLGSGIDNTIIQLRDNTPSASYVIGSFPYGCSNMVVADLTLDCNYNPASGGSVSYGGVQLIGTHITVRRVKVVNLANLDTSTETIPIIITTGGGSDNSEGNLIEECKVFQGPAGTRNSVNGLGIMGSTSTWISGIVRNNYIHFVPVGPGCQSQGTGGDWSRNSLFEGNYIKGATVGFYGEGGGSTNNIIAHNVFEDCDNAVLLTTAPRQNLTFCYNTISSTTSSGSGVAFRFYSNTMFTNMVIIGNMVTYNGNQPAPGKEFIEANNITGLIVANNTVEAALTSSFSSCTGVNMYMNFDLNGNLRTDLDTMGFSTMTSFGKSFLSSTSSNAALVSLGLPWNPAVIMTNNQSQPVTFNTNVTVNGVLNYSNMVAKLLAGTGVTASTAYTATGQLVTVNANSQTNGFGNIVTHNTAEFSTSANATITNVTISGALNYSNMVAKLIAGTGINASAVNTSTGQVVTVNANSIFVSTNINIPAASVSITNAHGLGGIPSDIRIVLVCVTNDTATGYTAGKEIDATDASGNTSGYYNIFGVSCDPTNIYIVRNSVSSGFALVRRTDGYHWTTVSSVNNFKLKIYARP